MSQQNQRAQKGKPITNHRNGIERLNEENSHNTVYSSDESLLDSTVNSFKDIGTGVFDQLLGLDKGPSSPEQLQQNFESKPKQAAYRESHTVYNFQKVEDERQIREIRELVEAIKQEIEFIKQADRALMSEVSDIENLTINSSSSQRKPGLYHIRFLEIILSLLKILKKRINESQTWLEAMTSKKKKRGSAFAALSKKQGTQYSLSQEFSGSGRSVQ